MKISKVLNVKTGVGRNGKNAASTEIGGIIYNDPTKYNKEMLDIATVVRNRSTAAGKMYNILNSNVAIYKSDKDKQKQKIVGNIIKAFNWIYFKEMDERGIFANDDKSRNAEEIKEIIQRNIPNKIKDIDILLNKDNISESEERLANDIINYALRKSLCRTVMAVDISGKSGRKVKNVSLYDLRIIARELLLATVIRHSSEEIDKIVNLDEKLAAFINYIYLDRNKCTVKLRSHSNKKVTRIQEMVDSIKKQNVKVQVVEHNNKKLLMLSNYNHPKKKYAAELVKMFANCKNKYEQGKIVIMIKQLIVWYIYGYNKESVIDSNNPWARFVESAGADLFDVKEAELLTKDNKKEDFKDVSINKLMGAISESTNERERKNLNREFERKMRSLLVKRYTSTLKFAKEKINEYINSNDKYIGKSDEQMNQIIDNELKHAKYWICYIEECVESFSKVTKKRTPERYRCDRLCNMVWEAWLSFVAMKYVDLGKAVYYFAMPENIYHTEGVAIEPGVVLDAYKSGLTSFDYERIKAEETLTRNIATAITFAANVFSNALIEAEYRSNKNNSDVLVYSKKKLEKGKKSDAFRNLLMYYGGQSQWEDVLSEYNLIEIADELRSHIANIRNLSYHFSTDRNDMPVCCNTYARLMFASEYGNLSRLIAGKYVTNNTLRFYSTDNISDLISSLYKSESTREAQIPAFNTILKKKDMEVFARNRFLDENNRKILTDTANKDIYIASLYYILKEIYYHAFITRTDLMWRFAKTFVKQNVDNLSDSQKRARSDFARRCIELGVLDYEKGHKFRYVVRKDIKILFSQFCQQIMTDYNMQNQNQKEVMSSDKKKRSIENGNKTIYEHYVLQIRATLLDTFVFFLCENKYTSKPYKFLGKPMYTDVAYTVDDLLKQNICVAEFNKLKCLLSTDSGENVKLDNRTQLMLDWYVAAHYMTAKQINLLIGDIRNYKQYISSIDRRANNTGNGRNISNNSIDIYEAILSVLEFVIQYVGRTSNNIEDYFESDEAYAQYISKFVDICEGIKKYEEEGMTEPYKNALKDFCNQKIEAVNSTDKTLRLYYDAKNPIPNKNVIYSLMYGVSDMLPDCVKKITAGEIKQHYDLIKTLTSVFRSGACHSEEQHKNLKRYQNQRNRIELLDLQVYTEIINDIMAQFVSWSYLRERDLLYFQLGYHYIRLYYGDLAEDSEGIYHKLAYSAASDDNGFNINITSGALLYQILAIYDYKLPMLKVNDSGEVIGYIKDGTAGSGVRNFVIEYCHEEYENGKAETYNFGLQFFGSEKDRDYYASFRKYIDHMKWYSGHDRSIWDMFGEIYNGFFLYDTKLKKSISFISKNILERYFVVADIDMKHGNGDDDKFRFCGELTSDKFTYKYNYKVQKEDRYIEKKIQVPAREDDFLEQLNRILTYVK